jgi:hypothetical protein
MLAGTNVPSGIVTRREVDWQYKVVFDLKVFQLEDAG